MRQAWALRNSGGPIGPGSGSDKIFLWLSGLGQVRSLLCQTWVGLSQKNSAGSHLYYLVWGTECHPWFENLKDLLTTHWMQKTTAHMKNSPAATVRWPLNCEPAAALVIYFIIGQLMVPIIVLVLSELSKISYNRANFIKIPQSILPLDFLLLLVAHPRTRALAHYRS